MTAGPRKATHALATTYVGTDGIKRVIHVYRLEDGSIAMHFTTYWDGADAEPMEAGLSLTPEAFNHLGAMFQAYHADRDRYAVPQSD